MVATHEVVPSAEGCVSHLKLDITGLMARLLTPLVRRNAQKVLAKEERVLTRSVSGLDLTGPPASCLHMAFGAKKPGTFPRQMAPAAAAAGGHSNGRNVAWNR